MKSPIPQDLYVVATALVAHFLYDQVCNSLNAYRDGVSYRKNMAALRGAAMAVEGVA